MKIQTKYRPNFHEVENFHEVKCTVVREFGKNFKDNFKLGTFKDFCYSSQYIKTYWDVRQTSKIDRY